MQRKEPKEMMTRVKTFAERARAEVERIKAKEAAEKQRLQERLAELSRDAARRREEAEAEERRQQEARRAERERVKEEDLKHTVFNSWVANGGVPGEFEAAWPELKAEVLKRRTLENEDAARKLQRASGVSRI
jgi:hypothetical protein